MEKIIAHIPHSSLFIPTEYEPLFYLSKEDLWKEQIYMTDLYTDEIFDSFTNKVVFPYSRLICDVERFRNKDAEEMTAKGMWICYTQTSQLQPLKAVNEQHETEILKLYDTHHEKLEKACETILDTHGEVLIVDCHSFHPYPLPYEYNQSPSRPDICIGVDSYHTPGELVEKMTSIYESLGYQVGINAPFSGTLTPLKYYHKNPSVKSVMIEINRKLYMDENGQKTENFDKLKQDIMKPFIAQQ